MPFFTFMEFWCSYTIYRNWDGAVGIATGYGLDGRVFGVRVPVGSTISILHVVQTDSRTQSASDPVGTGGPFPGDKAAWAQR
jgi:hypothetical protein